MSDQKQRIPTTKRLADALREANAPEEMIKGAEAGRYDDFKSSSLTPIHDLVRDCKGAGLTVLAARAEDGEFDAASWEGDEWGASSDGLATLNWASSTLPGLFGAQPHRSTKGKHKH